MDTKIIIIIVVVLISISICSGLVFYMSQKPAATTTPASAVTPVVTPTPAATPVVTPTPAATPAVTPTPAADTNWAGYKFSTNGRCGPKFGETACTGKACCSSAGWCGGSTGQNDNWCKYKSFSGKYNAEKP